MQLRAWPRHPTPQRPPRPQPPPPSPPLQVQKTLISACNLTGKPVIITRVVDTMVNTPRPTRAEATDIANAGELASQIASQADSQLLSTAPDKASSS